MRPSSCDRPIIVCRDSGSAMFCMLDSFCDSELYVLRTGVTVYRFPCSRPQPPYPCRPYVLFHCPVAIFRFRFLRQADRNLVIRVLFVLLTLFVAILVLLSAIPVIFQLIDLTMLNHPKVCYSCYSVLFQTVTVTTCFAFH